MTDETDEILADENLMEQFRKSREDIAAGKSVPLEDLDAIIDNPNQADYTRYETQSSPGANISLANRGDSNF